MSSHTSGVTGGDLVEQHEVSNLNLYQKEPMSSEWTDEKHSMYLKSMEASFVNQLYNSIESTGLRTHKKHHSQMRSCKQTESHPTAQFKVHQNGCWQRVKVGRGEPPPQQLEDSQFFLTNPWIQHFSSRGRENNTVPENASIESQTMRRGGRMMYKCGLFNITEHSSAAQAYQDSSVSREYSDQNFDDEQNGGGGGQVA